MVHYRPNVAALILRSDGSLFIGERVDRAGAWQFPQGGIDGGETPKMAFYREVREEVGLKKRHLQILEARSGYRYEFPGGKLRSGFFGGQEQTYFRCLLLGSEKRIKLETKHPEFRAFRWIKPEEFDLNWLPGFKKKVHVEVLWTFLESSPLTPEVMNRVKRLEQRTRRHSFGGRGYFLLSWTLPRVPFSEYENTSIPPFLPFYSPSGGLDVASHACGDLDRLHRWCTVPQIGRSRI